MKLNDKIEPIHQADSLFIDEIKEIVRSVRKKAYSAINFAQVEANWLVGKRIVQQEQSGKERAEYGKYIIHIVSQELTKEFGRGFSITNVKNFRKFYLLFNTLEIGQTVSDLLSWSH